MIYVPYRSVLDLARDLNRPEPAPLVPARPRPAWLLALVGAIRRPGREAQLADRRAA